MFTIPGLIKIEKKKVPARKARKGKTETAPVERAPHEAPRYKIKPVWRGSFLRELRNMRDYSKWELADEMVESGFGNTTPEMIAEWESGMTGPGANEGVVLARLLGVTISGLCAWDRVPQWVTPEPVVPGLAGIWSSAHLRELRGEQSLEDIARKLSKLGWDASPAELKAFETGRVPEFGEGVLLAKALGITEYELLVAAPA